MNGDSGARTQGEGIFPITLTGKEFSRIMGYKPKLDAALKEVRQLRSENRALRSRAAAAEKKAKVYAGIIRETARRVR